LWPGSRGDKTADLTARVKGSYTGRRDSALGSIRNASRYTERTLDMSGEFEPYSETKLAHQEPVQAISEWQQWNDYDGMEDEEHDRWVEAMDRKCEEHNRLRTLVDYSCQ
jgi:hypothetical protein